MSSSPEPISVVRPDPQGGIAAQSSFGVGSSSGVPRGAWHSDPIIIDSDSGDDLSSSSESDVDAEDIEDLDEFIGGLEGFEFHDGAFKGRSLRDQGVPEPPPHWFVRDPEREQSIVQHPLRAYGNSVIRKWRRDASVPEMVRMRPMMEGEDSTRLPARFAAVHPILFNYGLCFPLPRYLAHFLAYMRMPVGQLSANCLHVLTCLHVIWRTSGCVYPTPREILNLYRPRLGVRRGHHSVLELSIRTNNTRLRPPAYPLLAKLPTSQTVWRDGVFLATKGWKYTTKSGKRPFRSYGCWAGLGEGAHAFFLFSLCDRLLGSSLPDIPHAFLEHKDVFGAAPEMSVAERQRFDRVLQVFGYREELWDMRVLLHPDILRVLNIATITRKNFECVYAPF